MHASPKRRIKDLNYANFPFIFSFSVERVFCVRARSTAMSFGGWAETNSAAKRKSVPNEVHRPATDASECFSPAARSSSSARFAGFCFFFCLNEFTDMMHTMVLNALPPKWAPKLEHRSLLRAKKSSRRRKQKEQFMYEYFAFAPGK